MKFEELIVLLPCHSLEDFPVYQEGPQADGLLAAWSALWHPALLASAGRLPGWARADGPPADLANRLLVIPAASESLLLAGWASRAQSEGACVVRKLQARSEILTAALAGLDGGAAGVSDDLVADFLALGLCYLLVELLTRQMRYMSNLDEIHLRNEAVAAARAAVEGQEDQARDRLRNCFDVLTEARERFYPVEAYLIDLTLVAATTLGAGLRRELEDPSPKNLLMAAELLAPLERSEPATLAALRLALNHQTVAIVGGEWAEDELPLLSPDAVLFNLDRGAAAWRAAVGSQPRVYGRRRFGLSPALPLVLSRLGYVGALHATLEDGQFPTSGQSKIRWQGWDESAIDAVARLPLDANRPESLLGFSRKMGEAMDKDHVATLVFAHWPGQVSPYYRDLQRMSRYAPALGKFVTLTEYFERTERPGELTRFRADQYRSPYLRQAIIKQQEDPLGRLADYHRRRQVAENAHTLATLCELLGGPSSDEASQRLRQVDEAGAVAAAAAVDQDAAIAEVSPRQAVALAKALGGDCSRQDEGYVVLNPSNYTRQALVSLPRLPGLPAVGGAVQVAQTSATGSQAVVEAPAMGFVWIAPGDAAPRSGKAPKPLAEGETLRNEFLEVTVHNVTGGIRSIRDDAQRSNRLSQQLAFRLPGPRPKAGDIWRDPDEEAIYSVMAVDSIEVTSPGPAYGEIVSRGRLLDREGQRLAGYRQALQLWRGSRVVILDIELEVDQQPRADAWNSYYASRVAWGEEATAVWRSVGQTCQLTDAKHLEAPHLVELRMAKTRTAILTGGLPYHRRVGERMLDSLLVVRGETRRRFRLGIGIDLAHPLQQALDLLDPLVVVPAAAPSRGGGQTGWLFHVDARNVVATHWEPVREVDKVVGFRARLLEAEGRAGRVQLRCFRPLTQARQLDLRGETLSELTPAGDTLALEIGACEWIQVEGRWA